MKPDESLVQTSFFLTAAVRSWLVNRLLDPQDIDEIRYLLLELGYSDSFESIDMIDFLKSEMSRLNNGSRQNTQVLIRLCEGIVQFYLLRHPRKTPELDQLNSFLPPGLSFSSVTSRLIFEPEFFYQSHNLFIEEQAHWYLPHQDVKRTLEDVFPEPLVNALPQEARDPSEQSIHQMQEDPVEPSPHAKKFKTIRNQRLQLLKQWEQIP